MTTRDQLSRLPTHNLDITDKKLHISDVIVSSSMWYDNFKIGDTIRYDIIIDYRKTDEVKDFVLTEEILKNIKKYEDGTNFHNMRVVIRFRMGQI